MTVSKKSAKKHQSVTQPAAQDAANAPGKFGYEEMLTELGSDRRGCRDPVSGRR